ALKSVTLPGAFSGISVGLIDGLGEFITAFFQEREAECPADFVSVCRKVKPLVVHWAVRGAQSDSPKHRADYPAARPAGWPRPRVGCDFRNLCLTLKLVWA